MGHAKTDIHCAAWVNGVLRTLASQIHADAKPTAIASARGSFDEAISRETADSAP